MILLLLMMLMLLLFCVGVCVCVFVCVCMCGYVCVWPMERSGEERQGSKIDRREEQGRSAG